MDMSKFAVVEQSVEARAVIAAHQPIVPIVDGYTAALAEDNRKRWAFAVIAVATASVLFAVLGNVMSGSNMEPTAHPAQVEPAATDARDDMYVKAILELTTGVTDAPIVHRGDGGTFRFFEMSDGRVVARFLPMVPRNDQALARAIGLAVLNAFEDVVTSAPRLNGRWIVVRSKQHTYRVMTVKEDTGETHSMLIEKRKAN